MQIFGIPKHTWSVIAHKTLTENVIKFIKKLHCGIVVDMRYRFV